MKFVFEYDQLVPGAKSAACENATDRSSAGDHAREGFAMMPPMKA